MKRSILQILLVLVCLNIQASEITEHEVIVYKSAWCGCCSKWVAHMQEHGFNVIAIEVEDITVYKQQHNIPAHLSSCHTALIDDYVIEGHVPAADVTRLLRDRPGIHGLTVPGMPTGSPGMEQGNRVQAYDVIAINRDGTVYTYNSYPEQ